MLDLLTQALVALRDILAVIVAYAPLSTAQREALDSLTKFDFLLFAALSLFLLFVVFFFFCLSSTS